MKKAFIFIVPLLLFFGACQKDTVNLNCQIIPFQGVGKVYVDARDMATFENGDYININQNTYRVNVSGNRYTLNNIPYSSNGYKAVYPADGNTTATITLPNNQVFTPASSNSSQQRIVAPMAAQGTDRLSFYNLCSLIEVAVKAPVNNFTLRSIKVISSQYPLWGTFSMDWTGSVPKLTTPGTNSSTDKNTVILTCNYTFATANSEKKFFIIVPPFAEAQTLSVEVDGIAPYSEAGSNHNVEYFRKVTSSQAHTLAPSLIITGPDLATTQYEISTGHWDPYEIHTYEDLLFAASVINTGQVDHISGYRNDSTWRTGTWKIMNDIDCGNNTVLPLGAEYKFEGTLQGNNHTITINKLADTKGDIGFIGRLYKGCIIKDLTVDGNITVDHIYGNQVNVIGGICGCVDGSAQSSRQGATTITSIINCHNKANIGAAIHTEGTSAFNSDRAAHVGGVLGSMWSNNGTVIVSNCTNSGNINGIVTTVVNSGTGGIVGQHTDGLDLIINNCVNTGTIESTATHNQDGKCGAGGILGVMHRNGSVSPNLRIINCENRGNVTNSSNTTDNKYVGLGGICGVWNYTNSNSYIANCVNHGTVAHKNSNSMNSGYVGGILGYASNNNCPIKNCYSDGTLSGCSETRRGGIYGKNGISKTSNCYYLTGTANCAGNTNNSSTPIEVGTTFTDYSALLSNLNTWLSLSGNNPTDYPFASWVTVSGKPAPNGLPTVQ